jgi:hypothetical protein
MRLIFVNVKDSQVTLQKQLHGQRIQQKGSWRGKEHAWIVGCGFIS